MESVSGRNSPECVLCSLKYKANNLLSKSRQATLSKKMSKCNKDSKSVAGCFAKSLLFMVIISEGVFSQHSFNNIQPTDEDYPSQR